MLSSLSSFLMIAYPTTCLKLDTLVSLSQPTGALPPFLLPPQPGNPPGIYKPFCESTIKRRWLFSFKGGGEAWLSRWWLPWISLKSFWYNGTPTSDVSARGRGEEGVERERGRGRDEGKGKGRRECGKEGRQPVAHDHRLTSSYSTSLVRVHRWSRVKRGSSRSWKHISYFPSCAFFSAPWAN